MRALLFTLLAIITLAPAAFSQGTYGLFMGRSKAETEKAMKLYGLTFSKAADRKDGIPFDYWVNEDHWDQNYVHGKDTTHFTALEYDETGLCRIIYISTIANQPAFFRFALESYREISPNKWFYVNSNSIFEMHDIPGRPDYYYITNVQYLKHPKVFEYLGDQAREELITSQLEHPELFGGLNHKN